MWRTKKKFIFKEEINYDELLKKHDQESQEDKIEHTYNQPEDFSIFEAAEKIANVKIHILNEKGESSENFNVSKLLNDEEYTRLLTNFNEEQFISYEFNPYIKN